MPSFMQEPTHSTVQSQFNDNNTDSSISRSIMLDDDRSSLSIGTASLSSEHTVSSNNEHFHRTSSISSSASGVFDSLVQQNQTRIGYMKCLQIFFFHSSNLLLNKTNLQRDKIKNICCFTLEIYQLFIRNIKMDYYTWTMLITILLRIADFLFNSEYLVNNRNDPATSNLIKLTTETVLLAIVKASFSFNLNIELWDQLMSLMSSVSSNSDVIDKWIEVIDNLIRQVLKSCYNIDINNLPTIETDKRKIKKKSLYSTNGSAQMLNTFNTPCTTSASNQQPMSVPTQTKPRSRTEIYSPQSASTATLVNSPIVAHHPIQSQQAPLLTTVQQTPLTVNKNNNNISSTSQGSVSSTINVPAAVSAVQPLLSRQRKFFFYLL